MTHPAVDRQRRDEIAMWLANCHYVGARMRVLDPWEDVAGNPREYFYDAIWISINRMVPDVYPPHELTRQQSTQHVPEFMDTFERFVEWLRWCLRDMEMHECDERFVVVGQRIFDPHRQEKLAVPSPDPAALIPERQRALEEEGGWGRRRAAYSFPLGQAPSAAERALAYSGDLDLSPPRLTPP